MAIERGTEELKQALERHSVAGYPVEVPIFGPAKVESQSAAREQIYFKIRADKPMPFQDLAKRFNYTDEQMTLKQWEDKYVKGSTRSLTFLPWEIRERLEEGGKASQKDWLFQDLLNKGCLDLEQKVICYSFEYEDVHIPVGKLKKGMLVDYAEGRGEGYGTTRGWAGQIVGFSDDRDVILLNVFAPTPFMRAPEAIVPDKIRKGFFSSKVAFMGYGLVQAFEDKERTLPKGKWSEDEREWVLDETIELTDIEDFCGKHYKGEPHCIYHAMVMYIIPIKPGIGKFHPLPEAVVDPEIVVEYEEE